MNNNDETLFHVRMLPGDRPDEYLLVSKSDCKEWFTGCLHTYIDVDELFTKKEYRELQEKYPGWLPKFNKDDPHFEIVE